MRAKYEEGLRTSVTLLVFGDGFLPPTAAGSTDVRVGAARRPGTRGDAPGILIVDDDPDVLEGIYNFLVEALHPAVVHVARGPEEALEILRAERVDVVISDYRMPGGNGVELLAAVHARWPQVRGMLWTAYPDRGLAERAFRDAGAACFATKLAPPATLLEVVADLVAGTAPRRVPSSQVVVNPAWRST